jgi:hypothetical protein
MFLLVHVFRFNAAEVAEMFHRNANCTSLKLNRMATKYAALFSGQAPKEEIPIAEKSVFSGWPKEKMLAMM